MFVYLFMLTALRFKDLFFSFFSGIRGINTGDFASIAHRIIICTGNPRVKNHPNNIVPIQWQWSSALTS